MLSVKELAIIILNNSKAESSVMSGVRQAVSDPFFYMVREPETEKGDSGVLNT